MRKDLEDDEQEEGGSAQWIEEAWGNTWGSVRPLL
jgi:hypothetical protein